MQLERARKVARGSVEHHFERSEANGVSIHPDAKKRCSLRSTESRATTKPFPPPRRPAAPPQSRAVDLHVVLSAEAVVAHDPDFDRGVLSYLAWSVAVPLGIWAGAWMVWSCASRN